MKGSWNRVEATTEQGRQHKRVVQGLTAELNLYGREGIEPAVIHRALFDVQADLITTHFGAAAVAPSLREQAGYVDELLGHAPAQRPTKQAKRKTRRRS